MKRSNALFDVQKINHIMQIESTLSLRRTPLGPAPSVRLRENQIKGVKKGRDQL